MYDLMVRMVRPSTDTWLDVEIPTQVADWYNRTGNPQYVITWVIENFGAQFIPMEFFNRKRKNDRARKDN